MRIALPVFLALSLSGCECATRTNPVTGKSELSLFSDADEIALGEQAAPSMEQESGGLYRDSDLERYVASVGARLAAVNDRKGIPYRYRVLNSGIVNAFALPGGYVYISRGLLIRMKEECELAAVLGHETGHIAARHGIHHLQVSMGLNLLLEFGAQAAARVGPESAQAAGAGLKAARLVAQLGQLKYSRDDEREADHLGIVYAQRAGWDPRGMLGLMGVLKATEQGEPGALATLTRTHPLTSERIQNVESELAGKPASGTRSTPEFDRLIGILREKEKAQQKHEEARKHLKAKRTDQALAAADEAIRLEPSQASFHATRARILSGTRPEDARESARTAVRLDPRLYEAQLCLGATAQDRDALLKASGLWPSNPEPPLLLGNLAERRGRRDEAANWYAQAAQLGSRDAEEASLRLNPPPRSGR